MIRYYVTTSRGWLTDFTESIQVAYAAVNKNRNKTGLKYKVIKATPYRLILGNPIALSIPANADIVIENGIAYSYLKESYYEVNKANGTENWVCPYTGAIGQFDTKWFELWQK